MLPTPTTASQFPFVSSSGVGVQMTPGPGTGPQCSGLYSLLRMCPVFSCLAAPVKTISTHCASKVQQSLSWSSSKGTAVSWWEERKNQGKMNRRLARDTGSLSFKTGIGMGEGTTCPGIQWQMINHDLKGRVKTCKQHLFTTQPMTGSINAATSGSFYAI